MPDRRSLRLVGLAALMGLLLAAPAAVLLAAPAAVAQTSAPPTAVSPAIPAAQGVDAFTVSGVQVDVSAADANVAREQAIAEAQRKAWSELHRRIVPGGGAAPAISPADLARLVQAFSIDDERASATRYIATMTVRFRPDPVRDMLAGSGADRYVEPPTRPLVVLPVTMVDGRPVLWEDRTPWRAAWEERQPGASLVPLMVPDGELSDIAAIGVNEALAGDPTSLSNIAQRHAAGGVVVARTTLPSGDATAGGLSVEVTVHGPNGMRAGKMVDVRADPADRPADLLARAVTFTGAAVDDLWKSQNTVAAGPQQSIRAYMPITGIAQWLEARKRLAALGPAGRADMMSMSRDRVDLTLTFRGSVEELKQTLQSRAFTLVPRGGGAQEVWELRLAGPGAS